MQSWAAYRRERGSLNPMLRADRAAARQMKLYAESLRKKGSHPISLFDFIPHEEDPEKSQELTFDRAAELFR